MARDFWTVKQLGEIAKVANEIIREEWREAGWSEKPPEVSHGIARAVLQATAHVVRTETDDG